MKLTKKKAIEISIELWTYLAETGKGKWDWDGWKRCGEMDSGCPLCEYVNQRIDRWRQGGDCLELCPYAQEFGHCCGGETDSNYDKWYFAQTPRTRKKYAKLFLEQLREL